MTKFVTATIVVAMMQVVFAYTCRADDTRPIVVKDIDMSRMGGPDPWRLVGLDGKTIRSFDAYCADWAPDGSQLSLMAQGSIDLMTVTGKVTHLYNNFNAWVPWACPVWSPDSKLLAVPARNNAADLSIPRGLIVIFEVATRRLKKSVSVPLPDHVRWSRDASKVIEQVADTGDNGGTRFEIVNTSTWKASPIQFKALDVASWEPLASGDKLIGVVSARGGSGSTDSPSGLSTLSLADRRSTTALDAHALRSRGLMLSMTTIIELSPDGLRLAVSDSDASEEKYSILTYDISRNGDRLTNPRKVYGPSPDSPLQLAWSPDGDRLALIALSFDTKGVASPGLSIIDLKTSKVSKIATLNGFRYDPMIVGIYCFLEKHCLSW